MRYLHFNPNWIMPLLLHKQVKLQQQVHSADPPQHKESGFDLVQLLVGVVILGLLAAMLTGTFSGDKTKATRMVSEMSIMADNLKRAKTDLGCFPNRLAVLWDKAAASSTNMYCGIAGINSWSGPYIDPQPVSATTNAVLMPKIADTSEVNISRVAGGSLGQYYFLQSVNVPNAIIVEGLKACNGSETVTTSFTNSKCRAVLGVGAIGFGTFDMLIADSR
jgi:type II secretory pathway pseudopilin PulG